MQNPCLGLRRLQNLVRELREMLQGSGACHNFEADEMDPGPVCRLRTVRCEQESFDPVTLERVRS